MGNTNEDLISLKGFAKLYYKKCFNNISLISGLITMLSIMIPDDKFKLNSICSWLFLFICFSFPLALAIKELLDGYKKLYSENEKQTNDLANKDAELCELKNNRDTIYESYNKYKENNLNYEMLCNEVFVAIDVSTGENDRNKALLRLQEITNTIKNKYISNGDEYNGEK